MSKLSHSNRNLDCCLNAFNHAKALGKTGCASCGEDDFSPNVEAFEISGELVCDECAEGIFEENGQFGAGA